LLVVLVVLTGDRTGERRKFSGSLLIFFEYGNIETATLANRDLIVESSVSGKLNKPIETRRQRKKHEDKERNTKTKNSL
jgi:hypothetical protein